MPSFGSKLSTADERSSFPSVLKRYRVGVIFNLCNCSLRGELAARRPVPESGVGQDCMTCFLVGVHGADGMSDDFSTLAVSSSSIARSRITHLEASGIWILNISRVNTSSGALGRTNTFAFSRIFSRRLPGCFQATPTEPLPSMKCAVFVVSHRRRDSMA
jgi:hypothetical protein